MIWKMIAATMLLPLVCLGQDELKIINADFSATKLPPEIKADAGWQITDGVIRSKDTRGAFNITIHSKDWNAYDIEFKVRSLQFVVPDNHFGLIFGKGKDANRIYSRGKNLIYWIPSQKIHAAFGVAFDRPVTPAPDSPWTTFAVSVNGPRLTVKVDGKQVANTETFPEGSENISLYTYNNQIEVDDLRIVVYKTGAAAPAQNDSPNIALNASFEECTLDGLADYWGVRHWGIADPYWALNHDKWRQYFRTDDSTAWHGKRSMRIENIKDQPVDLSLVLTSCNFGSKAGSQYTYSAYLKADRSGVKVRMYTVFQQPPYDKAGKEFTLTEEWQRYDIIYTRSNATLYGDMLYLAMLNKGVIWIDAVQLENSENATPFQLANADKTLTVHEGNVEKQLFDVPVLKTPQLEESPVLDGRLADAVWSKVPAVELKSVSGKGVKEKATAKIFYTVQGIYIGIDAVEANTDQIVCGKKQRDEYVWTDPSFEIFLDSKLTRGTYHHLGFNADGVQYDANIGDSGWNGSWQVKTAKKPDNSGWTAEVFLPFGDLGIDYSNGPLWGFNLCRNNPRANEISCWAPTYGRFHSPLRFGQLTIGEDVQKQYLTGIRNAAILYAGEGQGELSVQVFNNTGKDRKLTVNCNLKDLKGKTITELTRTLDLPNQSSRNLSLGKVAANPGDTFLMEARILDGKTPLYTSGKKVSSAKILSALVQYDYYTKEKELTIRGQADLNDELLKKMTLEITVAGENGVVHQEKVKLPKRDFEKNLPIVKWANGDYRLTARLLAGDKEIAKAESRFQKLPPAANEVKLDRFRRITTVNGKPFFPLGFFWEGGLTPELVELLGKSGVNFIHTYNYQELVNNPALLETAQKYGVMFEVDVHAKKGKTADAINKLKHHPAILNWYTYDEAFTTEWGRTHQEEIHRTIADGQELDPYHPVIMLENSHGMNYVIEKDLYFPGKIPMLDVYTYPPSANVQVIDNASKSILELGKEDGRPGWFVLFASGYAFHASRDMTPAEHEYMAYICAINGIRGISYWAAFPKARSSFVTLSRLFKEIDRLKDTLISLEDAPNVACNSDNIKFTVKKHEGYLYLISVNESRNAVSARFDLSEIPEAGNAEVLFEDRSCPVASSRLEDTWQPLQRHVYRLKLK